ncbi:hypothetical protein BDV93DRAFT_545044 [Ceratobasidium sp. AG-I]|nr:hypothetical protein BDV93DRAFT_545044 [Ceratobasidium sp. AG-I]
MSLANNDPSKDPSSIRALRIPELACLFFKVAGKQCATRLGCTCWELFRSFMPLVWEHVSGASQVFNLIPSIYITWDTSADEMMIMLPDGIGGGDLIRLSVYAPFIKRLDVFRQERRKYSLLNWRLTLEYVDKYPLLPNLTSICFANREVKGYAQCVWLNIFISPTLREFEVRHTSELLIPASLPPAQNYLLPRTRAPNLHGMPGLTTRVACATFKMLLSQCPDLQKLSLFPSTTLEPTRGELPYLETAWQRLDVQAGYASRLTEMSITPLALTIFVKLDCPPFPVLERLRMYVNDLDDTWSAPLTRIIFPNLRKMAVLNLKSKKVLRRVWRMLGPAASQLTHVELSFESQYWPRRTAILDKEVLFLAAHSPQIVDLCLHPISCWRPVFASQAIMLLDKLPLERLQIPVDCFDSFFPPGFQPNHAFSRLRTLELPHHRASTLVLHSFAEALPLLEYLSVNFQCNDYSKLPEDKLAPRSTALRRLESGFYEPSIDLIIMRGRRFSSTFAKEQYETALEFARLLYSLWPNVQLIERVPTRGDEVQCATRAIGFINEHLSALACLNERLNSTHANFDSVDVMNKDSWMACYC